MPGRCDGSEPVTVDHLRDLYGTGVPIVMVTAYDYPSALVAEEAGVDVVLCGDTAATLVLGYESTSSISFDELLVLTRAVRRGLRTPLLLGDLPCGSYEASDADAVRAAGRLVQEAGCGAVKLERAGGSISRARAIVEAGIVVFGHVGLTPQNASALGGYRVSHGGRGAPVA